MDPSTEPNEGVGLRAEFLGGQTLFVKLENSELSSSDSAYQDDVKKAIQHFLRVSVMVGKLSVFSKNEILEDINTSDLKYLLTEYYLAELYTKLNSNDRQKLLHSAQAHFVAFLGNCQSYQILNRFELQSFERLDAPSKDANEIRQEKVDRHKRTKELKTKIATLSAQISKAGTAEDVDEETDRELTESLLHLFIENTMENLSMIKRELDMLIMVQKMKESGQDPLRPGQPEAPSKPFKPIVIQNTREILQQQVFRPGWNQPTMTLDEYVRLEEQRGNILTGGGPEQEARMEREKELKLLRDSEEDADEETMKQREKDEFNDWNPRGQGNRYNRS